MSEWGMEQIDALQAATQHVAEACGLLAALLLAVNVNPRPGNVVPFPRPLEEPVLPRVKPSSPPRPTHRRPEPIRPA